MIEGAGARLSGVDAEVECREYVPAPDQAYTYRSIHRCMLSFSSLGSLARAPRSRRLALDRREPSFRRDGACSRGTCSTSSIRNTPECSALRAQKPHAPQPSMCVCGCPARRLRQSLPTSKIPSPNRVQPSRAPDMDPPSHLPDGCRNGDVPRNTTTPMTMPTIIPILASQQSPSLFAMHHFWSKYASISSSLVKEAKATTVHTTMDPVVVG